MTNIDLSETKTPLIFLTTDFGFDSESIGIVKGIIIRFCPDANIIDLCNTISPYSIISAAWLLKTTISYLPKAIHIAVVDPGVGANRKGLIVKSRRGDIFIGPDNGILISPTVKIGGIETAISIENQDFLLKPISHCFHARDIFAPTAAHVANGVSLDCFGPTIPFDLLTPNPCPESNVLLNEILGLITYIDRFGNIFTNIAIDDLLSRGFKFGMPINFTYLNHSYRTIYCPTFSNGPDGQLISLDDSYGGLSIAINKSNAAQYINAVIGEYLTVNIAL